MILKRSYICLICAVAFLLPGCSSVDFEPHRKHMTTEESSYVPKKYEYKPIGDMYIGTNHNPSVVKLTRKRAKYQASTSLFEGLHSSSDFKFSVNRGRELQTGLNFRIDLHSLLK